VNIDRCPDGKGVLTRADQPDGQVVVGGPLSLILEGEQRLVDVIYDQVEVAVVIEVTVGSSVGEGGKLSRPVVGCVREGQVPLVAKEFVG
jgi:hypothetical protein